MVAVTAGSEIPFTLDDKYDRERGSIYLTGIQALVRMLLDRAAVDRAAGRTTAQYVSGYEGSPLAGYDLELARRRSRLDDAGVVHEPGLNEELAATAVSGTQLARSAGALTADGITGFWYGKAPGLDRATDALRHANLIGTDPAGGAVALVGDDPAAKSSSVPCASELALADLGIPTLFPADAAEVLEFGQHAVELSRFSGLWSALKITTMVADGATTANLGELWSAPTWTGADDPTCARLRPYSHRPSAYLLGAQLAELERTFHELRGPLALEYIRASGLNSVVGTGPARTGVVAAGSTYLALRQALTSLGLDESTLPARGIRLLKLGAVYPLEPTVVRDFAAGLARVVVVEDKRSFVEDAVRSVLYGTTDAPAVHGKRDELGGELLSPLGELGADHIARALGGYLRRAGVTDVLEPPVRRERVTLALAARTPFFCSGCPHNSSTEVAPGTLVGAGIGCHAMLLLMPGERAGTITGLTQMGGEGAQWLGMSHFVEQRHFVQNIGDGTFAHSGSLAIRAAVAAGANVTFKLLRNSAVAMTGGQRPVGEMTLAQLVSVLQAEGVREIVVTSDHPKAARAQLGRAHKDVRVAHRDDLLSIQTELAAGTGVSVLVHDQECAAEKRRKRRRGTAATPTHRVVINERVCEGCGDCGQKSNCLSVEPVATEFGRKTRINQSSCNLDYSCLDGDCPSFLTVKPGTAPRSEPPQITAPPEPVRVVPSDHFTMRITGIGGTGVVTVAQVLATAAAMTGRHVRTLDQTGLAQKGGAVVSDLVMSTDPIVRSPKLGRGECDLYLGCDALVAADPQNISVADVRRTVAVISSAESPTGQMIIDPAVQYPTSGSVADAVVPAVRDSIVRDATALAVAELGDEQYANMVLVGVAYQTGAVPMDASSIESAISMNGVAVAANVAAFRIGRLAAGASAGDVPSGRDKEPETLDELVQRRYVDLVAYQDERYAQRFRDTVARVQAQERVVSGTEILTARVVDGLYKFMAYKDEYEVARLSLQPELTTSLVAEFGPGTTFAYRLHPPVLRALGLRRKITLGPWFRPVFRVLAGLRRLRGTPIDPFGRAAVRRTERELIEEYLGTVDALLAGLTAQNVERAADIAALPGVVRGYEEIKLSSVLEYRKQVAAGLAEFATG